VLARREERNIRERTLIGVPEQPLARLKFGGEQRVLEHVIETSGPMGTFAIENLATGEVA
jgi:hypothetical protein